jgi:GT2 family glycosyltransferase/glycosyltransferase involved in cell wall biosynthesis
VTDVSIIVPVYNALEHARHCIESLYRSQTSVAFEVIVVDNGSRPAVAAWLAEQRELHANFQFLRFDEPLGFARAVNEGARRAQSRFVALLNSDTLVTDGWLDLLVAALEHDPELGLAGPVTNRCGHDRQRDTEALLVQPEDANGYAAAIRSRVPDVLPEAQRLVFFCVLVRRALWDQLAGLDEAFGTGNCEDDDFCLRARFAGYRMAVVRNAFVYHVERQTFEANRLNHGEFLATNEALFGARASRWSRTLRPPMGNPSQAAALSVIVPVLPARVDGLRDSLASLANQTVQGFETVVVGASDCDIAAIVKPFAARLHLTLISCSSDPSAGVAPLLNAGWSAAKGSQIAYLPAADVYYPFHLEVLLDALEMDALEMDALETTGSEAVFSGWSVVIKGPDTRERRATVLFPEAEPGVELGDWAPLLCWLHRKDASAGFHFDPSFGPFSPWAFVLELRRASKARYVCRVTSERCPDRPASRDAAEVQRVMTRFPVDNQWKESQRQQFLEGVRQGNWEDRLIVAREERTRRARYLLARGSALARPNLAELARLRKRLEHATSAIEPLWRESPKPDIFLFSIVEWTSLTQRPHHFAAGLAARGHRIFWVDVRLRPPERVDAANLVQEVQQGVYQLSLAAFAGDVYRLDFQPEVVDAMAACFAHVRAAYGISSAWQIVNFPRWEPLVTRLRRTFRWPVAYDCLDDQQAFAVMYGHDLGASEQLLLESSSHVLVSGNVLLKKIRTARPDAILIPNGSDFERFHTAVPSGFLDHLPRPIVGFFGAFSDWLDLDWIEAASDRFPGWSFVYIGREGFSLPALAERWKGIGDRSNVHVFPQASPEKLAQYVAHMDVCTMPFRDVPVARSMNAVKIYEYLAAAKPVVAVCLPETEPLGGLGLIATYRTREESFRLLEAAVHTPSTAQQIKLRLDFAARNTWNHRLDELSTALGL